MNMVLFNSQNFWSNITNFMKDKQKMRNFQISIVILKVVNFLGKFYHFYSVFRNFFLSFGKTTEKRDITSLKYHLREIFELKVLDDIFGQNVSKSFNRKKVWS